MSKDDVAIATRTRKFPAWKIDLVKEAFEADAAGVRKIKIGPIAVEPDPAPVNDPPPIVSSGSDQVSNGQPSLDTTTESKRIDVKIVNFNNNIIDSAPKVVSQRPKIIDFDVSSSETVSSEDSLDLEEVGEDPHYSSSLVIKEILTEILDNLASVQVSLLQDQEPSIKGESKEEIEINGMVSQEESSKTKENGSKAKDPGCTIVDIDFDSSGDEELLSLKYVPPPVKEPVSKVLSVDSLLEPLEENLARMVVEELLDDLIDEIIDKNTKVVAKKKPAKPVQTEFQFASSDIRYTKDGKKVQDPGSTDTGLSLFIVGMHPRTVLNLVSDIKKIPHRTIYETCTNTSSQVFRMDFIFKTALDRKLFEGKCLKLPKSAELNFVNVVVPAETMCHTEQSPQLTEQELLVVMDSAKTENLFKAFEVKLVKEKEGTFLFVFQSILSLNMFLFCTMGVESGPFLGQIRDKAWHSTKTLRFLVKGKDSFIPVKLSHEKFSKLNLKDVMDKFKASIFRQYSNRKEAQVNFPNKEAFYKFLTSKESRYFDKIKFDVKS